MSRQSTGVLTRSAAANQLEQGPGMASSRVRGAAQTGKRLQEDDGKFVDLAGSKKGRAAFEDITTALNNKNAQQAQPQHKGVLQARGALNNQAQPSTRGQEQFAPSEKLRLQEASTAGPSLQRGGYSDARPDCEPRGASPSRAWKDIDALDRHDHLACVEYLPKIMQHLREAELRRRPSTCYLETVQTDINPSMRAILVDWLVEVAQEYNLVSDTLFLAVSYIDRYLSLAPVPRSRLQLVGVTCMLLAAKYEEIYAPQVEEFCYITDNTYAREEVLQMEHAVLTALDFELTVPTAKVFLRRYLKAAAADYAGDPSRLEFLAAYICELALPAYGLLGFLPSHIAAAAVALALLSLGRPAWTPTLTHYTGGLTLRTLRPMLRALHHLFAHAHDPSALPAVREKYGQPKYGCVSSLAAPETLPEWLFQ